MKNYNLSLFIFRRDLRLEDNTALVNALQQSEQVIPCFVFDPRQIGNENEFKSDNAIQFMIESLEDLQKQLKNNKGKLYLFYGKAEDIVEKLFKELPIDAIFLNKDYTPFSINRDAKIEVHALENKAQFRCYDDILLNDPEEIMTTNGTPYSVFTAYFKKTSKIKVSESQSNNYENYYKKDIKLEKEDLLKKILRNGNKNLWERGGRNNALKILKKLSKFKDYAKIRDYPSKDTTYLSAHNKFGTVSIREVYHAICDQLSKDHLLIKQLYWRDFYTYVAYHSPFVYGHAYKEKYDNLEWNYNKKNFEAWCNGKTGFPIVDAGMRQLNETGFMHNRVRMIVASFLTKDLHIDWLQGEKYFAQKLVDYDPAVNNGNWQWVSSTGCDAQPYFRIFNPWAQQEKFDPKCVYIKQWVPELKNIDPKKIHKLYKLDIEIKNYIKPIIDHDIERKEALKRYKNI